MRKTGSLLVGICLIAAPAWSGGRAPEPSGESCGRANEFLEGSGDVGLVILAGIGCRGAVGVDVKGWLGHFVGTVPRHLAAEVELHLPSLALAPGAEVVVLAVSEADSYVPEEAPPPEDFLARLVIHRRPFAAPNELVLRIDWNGSESVSIDSSQVLPNEDLLLRLLIERVDGNGETVGRLAAAVDGLPWIEHSGIDMANTLGSGPEVAPWDPAALVRFGSLVAVSDGSSGLVAFRPTAVEIGWGRP
jgi:hypothetical protein